MRNFYKRKCGIVLAIIILITYGPTLYGQKKITVSKQTILMGSVFHFTVVASDSLQADQYIQSAIEEVSRIENLISEWIPDTEVSQVNQNAGIKPIKVSKEVFDLTERAINYSKMSGGAFDISTAAMDHIWRFDGSMDSLPSTEEIKQSIKHVNYKDIILDKHNSTIFLKNKGMKIGFGSIGKGYAADQCRAILQAKGVIAGLVDASGDIATWGTLPNKNPWRIGIRNPFRKNKIIKVLKLYDSAVATSGSYEKYVEFNNIRYAHIINPKTGYPATGLTSVTIYGPNAEFANALSTSIMVLGIREGKNITKLYPEYNFLILTDKGNVVFK